MSCETRINCLGYDRDCWRCKFSGDSGNIDNCYSPIDKSIKHPQIMAAKTEKKQTQKREKKNRQLEADKAKKRVVKNAAKSEAKVMATLNSGRINCDGDLHTSDITIDVKLQSTRVNPVISIEEFVKCTADAERSGRKHGVLIIENKNGMRFVVMSEDLFRTVFV